MTAPRRHSYQVVRNRAQNPRRITIDESEANARFEQRCSEAERNHQPAIMTRQGLIDAGLLAPGK